MATLLNIFIFIIGLYLQTDFLSRFNILGLEPNLLLVIVIAFALYGKAYEAYAYAFAAGLVMDTLFGGPYGYHITFFMAIVFAASLISKGEGQNAPNILSFVFATIAVLLFYVVLFLIVGFGSENFTLSGGIFTLEQAGVTSFLAFLLLPQAKKLFILERRLTDARRVR